MLKLQEKGTANECTGIEWSNFFENVGKFCYLGDAIGAIVVGSVFTEIRNGWSKFIDLLSFLTNRDLPLEKKYIDYIALKLCSILLYQRFWGEYCF